MPITTMTNSTSPVNCLTSGQVGQDTLRSSPAVSLKNAVKAFGLLTFAFLSAKVLLLRFLRLKRRPSHSGVVFFRQARQDLNPQPLVLETSALPIELLAFGVSRIFSSLASLIVFPVHGNYETNEPSNYITISFRDAWCVSCNAGKTC